RAVTDIAGPVCGAQPGEYDEKLSGRLQYELNQLIGLRDYHTADAEQAGPANGEGGGPPEPLGGRPSLPLRRVNAFLTEVRSVEAEWFSELLRERQGFVVGSSPWNGRSAVLDEIKSRHGLTADDVLVRSITSYIREREQIGAE